MEEEKEDKEGREDVKVEMALEVEEELKEVREEEPEVKVRVGEEVEEQLNKVKEEVELEWEKEVKIEAKVEKT